MRRESGLERNSQEDYTHVSSGKGRGRTSYSRGKSKKPKRIVEGRKHKTKKARLQCGQCGAWFESLGQINQHYGAVGHKRKRKPPKAFKFSKDYSPEEVQMVEGLLECLRNPIKIRKMVRERLAKRRLRIYEY